MTHSHSISHWQDVCFINSYDAGWWPRLEYGDWPEKVSELVPTKLCLIHSEISEAMEGHRKGLMDSHLPHREMMEVELADAVIRILDLAGAMKYSIEDAMAEKIEYNLKRKDHSKEVREDTGGKRY